MLVTHGAIGRQPKGERVTPPMKLSLATHATVDGIPVVLYSYTDALPILTADDAANDTLANNLLQLASDDLADDAATVCA